MRVRVCKTRLFSPVFQAMIIVILFVAFGILVPDLYIWSTYVRQGAVLWSAVYWIPSLLFVLLSAYALVRKRFSASWMNMLATLLLGVALPKALFALVSWLGERSSVIVPWAQPLGYYAGLGIAAAVCTLSFFGIYVGWKLVIVRNVELAFPSLPQAFDGYRIVQLSDFHIGTYSNSPSTVSRIVERVNALEPDMVVFTGDLVNLRPSEVDPFMPVLAGLRAADGVYSILGNHDYCPYVRYKRRDGARLAAEEVCRKEREMGWHLLLNESAVAERGGERIAVVGVENEGKPPFPARADLARAMSGLPGGIFKILLTHDPSHWRREVVPDTDIPLTLAGHTHGMQFRLGPLSPSRFVYPEWGGLYARGSRRLYVSTGVGSNLTFRFGAWPEIVCLTLRRGQAG